MPPRNYKSKKGYKGKRTYKKQSSVKRQIARALVAYQNKNVEVKKAVSTSADGAEIYHNNFITLDSGILVTSQGTSDPQTNNSSCRVGDELKLRGVSLKMMLELNERYSDCTFKLIVVKCARGDTPTRANLYNGISGNKMIDTFNTERFTILLVRNIQIRAPNYATTGGTSIAGYAASGDASQVQSRATKILNLWLPYKLFSKTGIIKYENNSSQTKFYDYHVLLYAYTNYSTPQDIYYVGRCNDYVKTMYFTDQ